VDIEIKNRVDEGSSQGKIKSFEEEDFVYSITGKKQDLSQ